MPVGAAGEVAVALSPATTLRGHRATLIVTGDVTGPLTALLVGATHDVGRPWGWIPLRRDGQRWRVTLPAPELRGVYQLELRDHSARKFTQARRLQLRVFASDTAQLPTFTRADGVARWWLRSRAGSARLAAIRLWPAPAFDRRDARLHQLMVIAYDPAAAADPRDRLGMFITAVRDAPGARWRFLEATVQP
jgi:hypothetical protein